ncbi:MAG: deoxyribose-phosphate aldolase [Candidatus Melainabacteria bacterium]
MDPDCRHALASLIDHTYLAATEPGNDRRAVMRLCAEAIRFGFVAVCVRPPWVSLARRQLWGSTVRVATVIGFPANKMDFHKELGSPGIGNASLSEKITEARQAIADGADELDWVLDVGAFQRGWYAAEREIREAVSVSEGRPVKLIVEADLLSNEELTWLAPRALQWGVAMVKTSTGMLSAGEGGSLRRMTQLAEILTAGGIDPLPTWPLKASGGIRTLAHAEALLNLGIRRIGTSAGVSLMEAL